MLIWFYCLLCFWVQTFHPPSPPVGSPSQFFFPCCTPCCCNPPHLLAKLGSGPFNFYINSWALGYGVCFKLSEHMKFCKLVQNLHQGTRLSYAAPQTPACPVSHILRLQSLLLALSCTISLIPLHFSLTSWLSRNSSPEMDLTLTSRLVRWVLCK